VPRAHAKIVRSSETKVPSTAGRHTMAHSITLATNHRLQIDLTVQHSNQTLCCV